jgi:hypothetical protein
MSSNDASKGLTANLNSVNEDNLSVHNYVNAPNETSKSLEVSRDFYS